MDAALRRVAKILNKRPLTVRAPPEDSFHTISPADLLLGHAAGAPQDFEELEFEKQDTAAESILSAQEEIAREWWAEWTRNCFQDLVPRSKWKIKTRSLEVGDVTLLQQSSKFSAPVNQPLSIIKVGVQKLAFILPAEEQGGRRKRRQQRTPPPKLREETKKRQPSTQPTPRRRKRRKQKPPLPKPREKTKRSSGARPPFNQH